MVTRKKRTPSPKSAHIAVQSHVSSLEDEAVSADPPIQELVQVSHPVTDTIARAPSLEDMLSQDAPESELTSKNSWIYRFGLIVMASIILLCLGIYGVYLQSSSAPAVPVSQAVPTPFPTPTIDMTTITIEVFNGSGIAGKASKTADALKSIGYRVVGTGNAKKIPGSTVAFSSTLSERAKELIRADLRAVGISSISSTIADSSISARVTLGLK